MRLHRGPRLPLVLGLLMAACQGGGGGGGAGGGGPQGPGADYRPCGDQAVWYHVTPFGNTPEDILAIEPLGHVIAPGHTWPSDHLYLTPRTPASPQPVRAPGDIRVWQVDVLTHQHANGPRYTDYSLRFSPCRELQGFFHHVHALVHPALLAAVAGGRGDCTEMTFENGEYQSYCRNDTAIDVLGGEMLGTASGPGVQANIDFGAYDTRTPTLGFANPHRVSESVDQARFDYLHVVCPLDAFEPDTRAALTARLGGISSTQSGLGLTPRTLGPLCGTTMQDLPGTAQGIWALEGQGGIADVSRHLALVHDNFDPTRGVLASGGGPVGIRQSRFVPAADGVVNRDFSAVVWKGDGSDAVHCYDLVGATSQGSVMLQLTSATSLQAEYRPAGCTAPAQFVAPATYRR